MVFGVTAAGGGGSRTIVVDPWLRDLLCISASARTLFIVLMGNSGIVTRLINGQRAPNIQSSLPSSVTSLKVDRAVQQL